MLRWSKTKLTFFGQPEPGEIFIRGRIADYTEEGQTEQEVTEGGESLTIQRGKAEAIQNQWAKMGGNRRQYREERQRLYTSKGRGGENIADNTRRKCGGDTKQEDAEGEIIADNTER